MLIACPVQSHDIAWTAWTDRQYAVLFGNIHHVYLDTAWTDQTAWTLVPEADVHLGIRVGKDRPALAISPTSPDGNNVLKLPIQDEVSKSTGLTNVRGMLLITITVINKSPVYRVGQTI